MIPTSHGQPLKDLVPWTRMWRTQRGTFYVNLWKEAQLILAPPSDLDDPWTLFFDPKGQGPFPLACLWEGVDNQGVPFLHGRWGLGTLLALENPPGIPEPLTLYLACKIPVPWTLDEDVFSEQTSHGQDHSQGV